MEAIAHNFIDPPAEGAPEGTTALADVEGSNPDFDAEAATADPNPAAALVACKLRRALRLAEVESDGV